MKKYIRLYPLLALALLSFLFSCRKDVTETNATIGSLRSAPLGPVDSVVQQVVLITDSQFTAPPVLPPAPMPQLSAPQNQSSCSALPIYGDSIIFPQPVSGSDYIVAPVNNPGPGKYLSWPVGMVIDSTTGAIDLTASETGLKYAIGFVKSGTTDTCMSTLIIGGMSYPDSIYVIQSGQDAAQPYFNADPNLLSVCNGNGNGSGCAFDVTGSAASQKVIVDPNSGQIDLKKTLNGTSLLGLGGAFGLIPVNGQTITTSIYYKLNDGSADAMQHIDVQLVYYDSKSLINIALLNNILTKLDNLTSGNMISTSTNPRPPLIVIVRHN
jgi:hypothetical protein